MSLVLDAGRNGTGPNVRHQPTSLPERPGQLSPQDPPHIVPPVRPVSPGVYPSLICRRSRRDGSCGCAWEYLWFMGSTVKLPPGCPRRNRTAIIPVILLSCRKSVTPYRKQRRLPRRSELPNPLPGKAANPADAPRPVWDGAPEVTRCPKRGMAHFSLMKLPRPANSISCQRHKKRMWS